MPESPAIITHGEAAVMFGVRPQTIGDLTRLHRLTAKPVPRNGNAKGLDEKDMRLLRRLLNAPHAKAIAS